MQAASYTAPLFVSRMKSVFINNIKHGNLLLNQQAGTYDERFKFTGKERDEETGYDFKIITGEKTHVSSKIPSDVEIIRRSDLGPQ